MKKSLTIWAITLALIIGIFSYTSAYRWAWNWYNASQSWTTMQNKGINWYQWKNTSSPTFVDQDKDWVCDNYKNRPMDWTGKKYGRQFKNR